MKTFYRITYILALAMCLVSCRMLPGKGPSINKTAYLESDVFALYLPFQTAGNVFDASKIKSSHGFKPITEHGSWHTGKMDSDLREMSYANIDGVLLCISPFDMADKDRREMIGHFLEKCGDIGFKVVIYLTSDTPIALRFDNVISYVCGRGWDKSPAIYKIDGRIPLGFSRSISLIIDGENTDFMPFSIIDKDNDVPGSPLPCPFTVVKSVASPETLRMDRSNGRFLINAVNHALEAESGRILILSWNFYADGTAIEKNTFDYDTQLKVLH